MAFPMDGTHLLAHLRTVSLIMTENDQDMKPVIKAVKTKDSEEDVFRYLIQNLQSSPPIAFDLGYQIEKQPKDKSSRLEKSERVRQKRSRARKERHGVSSKEKGEKLARQAENSAEGHFEDKNGPGDSASGDQNVSHKFAIQEVSTTPDKRSPQTFQSPRWRSNSRLDESQQNHHLGQIEEEITYESLDDDLAYFDDSTGLALNENANEDDVDDLSTLDSDIELGSAPLTHQGSLKTIKRLNDETESKSEDKESQESTFHDKNSDGWSPGELDITDEETESVNREVNNDNEENDVEDDDDDDDDVEEDMDFFSDDEESYSSDSAFTDIETDSLLNSSLLLNSYDINTSTGYLLDTQNNLRGDTKKSKKKKQAGTFASQSLPRDDGYTGFKRGPAHSLANGEQSRDALIEASGPSTSNGVKQSTPKNDMMFEKVDIGQMPPKQKSSSNLSQMIKSRIRVNITNPLNYYSFVQSSSATETDTCAIDVFVPPQTKPTLKGLLVKNKLPVVDLIGFILLKLSSSKEFVSGSTDLLLMNPNNWRLELVDEDGENYGSFGILDRTRLLSSYNNPTELAICKVEDESEEKRNERQSPLPVEFKQGLLALQKKDHMNDLLAAQGNTESSSSSEDMIEIKILGLKMTLSHDSDSLLDSIFISRKRTVQELIEEICISNGFSPSDYQLKLVHSLGSDQENKNSRTNNIGPKDIVLGRVVEGSAVIGNLNSTTFKIELKAGSEGYHDKLGPRLSSQMGITPSHSIYSSIITPTNGNLDEGNLNFPSSKPKSSGVEKENVPKVPHKKTYNEIFNDSKTNDYLNDIITGKNLLPTNLNTIYFKWKIYRKKTAILNKIEKSLIIDGDYIHLAAPDDIVPNNTTSDATFSAHGTSSNHHIHHYNYSNYYKESLMKTSSFHITQIVKVKQYSQSKHQNHFKIVISKSSVSSPKDASIRKKYDLEALNSSQCQEIIDKIKWVSQIYNQST